MHVPAGKRRLLYTFTHRSAVGSASDEVKGPTTRGGGDGGAADVNVPTAAQPKRSTPPTMGLVVTPNVPVDSLLLIVLVFSVLLFGIVGLTVMVLFKVFPIFIHEVLSLVIRLGPIQELLYWSFCSPFQILS